MTTEKILGLLVCKNFRNEFQQTIKKLDYTDVVLGSYRGACGNKGKDDNVAAAHLHLESRCDDVRLVSPLSCAGCSKGLCRAQFFSDQSCLEYFIPNSMMQYLIGKGKYLISPGWLFDWENTIKVNWAFQKEQARDFFKETANEIVVLDTGVYPDFSEKLKELSDFINLEYTIIPVGLDYLELKLASLVADWRKSNNHAQILKERNEWQMRLANCMMLYDVIPRLAAKEKESDLLQVVEELLHSLLAPNKVTFYRSQFSTSESVQQDFELLPEFDYPGMLNWDEDKGDIRIKVSQKGEDLLWIHVEKLLYPQYAATYMEILEIVTNFLGLFILNARQNQIIRKANRDAIDQGKKVGAANLALSTLNTNLNKAKEEAEKAVATKDKFFSIIAHDLRSPFNGMMGFSSILNESYDDLSRDEHLEYLEIINKSLNSTFRLLEDLLSWSRAERGVIPFKPSWFKSRGLVESTKEELFQSASSKSVEIVNNLPQDLELWVDKDLMSGVFRNVLSNAIKFTPNGGTISIDCTRSDSDMIEIQISDTGVGMSPEKIATLFDVGKNSSSLGTEQEKGSGLGLILCKEFIDIHKGMIKVVSEPGKGSTFAICLPVPNSDSR